MKLLDYARRLGISYRTVRNYFKQGKLDAYQTYISLRSMTVLALSEAKKALPGTIIVREPDQSVEDKVAIYCRVSSAEKNNLESQKQRLLDYCAAKGYKVSRVVTEIGSGVNDTRKQWLSLLQDRSIRLIVVEHKDRFTRFGFNAYKVLLNNEGRDIEVINTSRNGKEDLMQDLVSIITSFCARLYGQRRNKRKTEKIIKELQDAKDIQA